MISDASTDVSRETAEALLSLERLVLRWTMKINLVSKGSLSQFRQRHIRDSAQIFQFCPPGVRLWVDLGSGGGFPGLVVAILAREAMTDLRVTLVEADARKAAFLRVAAATLAPATTVMHSRIEAVEPLKADVVSARALAPLLQLLPWVDRHLAPGGLAILLKGAAYGQEVEAAKVDWAFDFDVRPSRTNPDGVILLISNLQRRS